jgi:hypothetical protein
VLIASTSVKLTSAPNPASAADSVLFTAAVTGKGGTPTGNVTFLDGSTSLGVAVLSAGVTSLAYAGFTTAGVHSITASYAGDGNDAASVSSPLLQTITLIPTTTTLGATNSTGATPQTIVATVAGVSGPTPTGTVAFSIGANPAQTLALDANGMATLPLTGLAPGSYTAVAVYSGDTLHSPSTSAPLAFSVNGFVITVSPSSITLPTTENRTVEVTVAAEDGFADTIVLGCASPPTNVTCHFADPSVKLTANGSQTVALTIDTNYPPLGGASALNAAPSDDRIAIAGLLAPFGLLLLFHRRHRRGWSKRYFALGLLFALACMLISACSGITRSSATPGSYTLQITGTGTASNLTRTLNLTLTITP